MRPFMPLPLKACLIWLLLCSVNHVARAATPEVQWTFARAELRDRQLIPTVGKLAGQLSGSAKLATQPPRLELDGKSQVVARDIARLALPQNHLTIATWVRVDQVGEWCGFVSAIQDNGSFERGWLLGSKSGCFCFGLTSTTKQKLTYLSAPDRFALGVWYHIAGVYDGQQMQLYVDGELAAQSREQTGAVAYPDRGVFALGAYVDDNETYPLRGALAATALYAQPLAPNVIAQQYAQTKKQYPGTTHVADTVVGWPTYMHDATRTGITQESIQLPLHLQWTYRAMHPPQPAWPSPAKQDFWRNKFDLPPRVTFDRAMHVVSDGEQVYFGSSADDQVRALDLQTGEHRWSFFTAGPVRLAPTIAAGKAYVGSDDGCVYCLETSQGDLVWRFSTADATTRVIPGNRRLISTLPVRTGVLINSGTARFGAGLFPSQGTFQFALAATSGRELARGPLNFSPQGYLQQQGGELRIARGRAPTTSFARLPKTQSTKTPLGPASNAAYPHARIRAGQTRIYGGDDKVAAFTPASEQPVWQADVPGKALSLAVANGRLLVSTDTGNIVCFGPEPRAADEVVHHRPSSVAYRWQNRAEQQQFERWGKQVAARTTAGAGYCLLLAGDTRHALALAQQTSLQIVAVVPKATSAARMRQQLSAIGIYGRVVVRVCPGDALPFANRLFNLIVSANTNDAWPPETITPLVRPDGTLIIESDQRIELGTDPANPTPRWLQHPVALQVVAAESTSPHQLVVRRPALADSGRWTHMYADPGNSACSQDRQVKGELELQWFGPPGPLHMVDRHHRTTPPLYSAGRLFIPGNEIIFGVDAYNGATLWKQPLPGFRRVGAPRDAGNMATTADTLYAVAQDQLHGFATHSGQPTARFPLPEMPDNQPRHWGYVAVIDDLLYGSTTWPKASRSGHHRKQIDETYYDGVSLVTSDSLFCLDRQQAQNKWHYLPQGAILNPTITIGGNRVYFVESNIAATKAAEHGGRRTLAELFSTPPDLVALDRTTGQPLWRRAFDFTRLEHHLYLAYADERLVAVGTRNEKQGARNTARYDLAVFNAADGTTRWTATQDSGQAAGGSHGEQDHHLAIIGNVIVQEPFRYELHTGKRLDDWKFARGGHGCGSISASAAAFFYRAGNPTMCDLATGQRRKVNTVSRPGCWINMIPAGGLLLIPEASSGCTCDFPIQSSMAFAPRAPQP